ncbi:MAG TPA: monooxygenase [Polyangiaceae bacterium]
MRRNLVTFALLFSAGAASACSKAPAPDEGKPGESTAKTVSYYRDVKPILDGRCIDCHTDGGIAPFSLSTYGDLYPWLSQIKRQVTSRTMPPWTAGADCNEYIGDPSLSDAQIQAIASWVDGGGLEGDPADEGAPIPGDEAEAQFRVGVRLEMPADYTPSLTPDEYRCFVLPWPEERPTYITGLSLRPGNKALVHHSVLTLVEPESVKIFTDLDDADPGQGYTCFTNGNIASSSGAKTSLIGALEKPENGRLFPHETGLLVKPGSAVILQLHYNTLATGGPAADRTSVEFSTAKEVPHPAHAVFSTDPRWILQKDTMHIAAGDPDAWVAAAVPAGFVSSSPEFDLHWADLHMHTLGSHGELSLIHADGTKECLLRVDQWKFQWQQTFYLKNPVHVTASDQLYIECHWDNTISHQYVVDGVPLPTHDVSWGDGSRDEMCLGNYLVTSDQQTADAGAVGADAAAAGPDAAGAAH